MLCKLKFMYLRGNSLVPLGPISVTLAATMKLAGVGLSVRLTVTSRRCVSASQFLTLRMTVAAFLAAVSTDTWPLHSGAPASPRSLYNCADPSGSAMNN